MCACLPVLFATVTRGTLDVFEAVWTGGYPCLSWGSTRALSNFSKGGGGLVAVAIDTLSTIALSASYFVAATRLGRAARYTMKHLCVEKAVGWGRIPIFHICFVSGRMIFLRISTSCLRPLSYFFHPNECHSLRTFRHRKFFTEVMPSILVKGWEEKHVRFSSV